MTCGTEWSTQIYEVYVGGLEADGKFADFVRHAPDSRQQTATYCSSTDPWHTLEDLSPYGDQTGWTSSSPAASRNQ
jgi:hypothetical protein